MKKINFIKSLLAGIFISTSFFALSHAGHGSNAPWEACADKKLNDECTYSIHHQKATGTCQAMNEVLMCVRNQPLENIIEKATQKPSKNKSESILPIKQ